MMDEQGALFDGPPKLLPHQGGDREAPAEWVIEQVTGFDVATYGLCRCGAARAGVLLRRGADTRTSLICERGHDADDPEGSYPEKLYDGGPPHEQTPTSAAAASSMRGSAQPIRDQVLKLIVASGYSGRTDDELEELLGMRHQTISARRRELVLLGEIIDSGLTRKTRSGRQATRWIGAEVGRDVRAPD